MGYWVKVAHPSRRAPCDSKCGAFWRRRGCGHRRQVLSVGAWGEGREDSGSTEELRDSETITAFCHWNVGISELIDASTKTAPLCMPQTLGDHAMSE